MKVTLELKTPVDEVENTPPNDLLYKIYCNDWAFPCESKSVVPYNEVPKRIKLMELINGINND